jgi:hypothetical protein
MHFRLVAVTSVALFTTGCSTLKLPKTPGELASNYGYVPLDPLAVSQTNGDSCAGGTNIELVPVLDALPDLAVRFAVADVSANGGLTFGPSKLTAAGSTYRAVLDYVNVDAVPVDFSVLKIIRKGTETRVERPTYRILKDQGETIDHYEVKLLAPTADADPNRVTIPVYIGVGLRLSADIRSLKSNISLSGLGAIGAEAEAKALAGTLTVQTLGVNGPSLATALPLPNKLDQTTIENGILAIGTSRAMLYTAGVSGTAGEKIVATPRVVGLYSPIGSDPQFINAVYAELSRVRPVWHRPCRPISKNGGGTPESKPTPDKPSQPTLSVPAPTFTITPP